MWRKIVFFPPFWLGWSDFVNLLYSSCPRGHTKLNFKFSFVDHSISGSGNSPEFSVALEAIRVGYIIHYLTILLFYQIFWCSAHHVKLHDYTKCLAYHTLRNCFPWTIVTLVFRSTPDLAYITIQYTQNIVLIQNNSFLPTIQYISYTNDDPQTYLYNSAVIKFVYWIEFSTE